MEEKVLRPLVSYRIKYHMWSPCDTQSKYSGIDDGLEEMMAPALASPGQTSIFHVNLWVIISPSPMLCNRSVKLGTNARLQMRGNGWCVSCNDLCKAFGNCQDLSNLRNLVNCERLQKLRPSRVQIQVSNKSKSFEQV